MSTHTSLDAAATERKARLAKLKSLKRKAPSSSTHDSDQEADHASHTATAGSTEDAAPPDVSRIYLSGRNYDADSKAPKLGFEHAPSATAASTLEIRAREIADATAEAAAKEAETEQQAGIDLFKLQPKKPNWDLKRDLARKLEVLDVRTDNAIARMVRERIQAQKDAQKAKAGGGKVEGDAEGAEVLGLKGEELVEGIHQREREEAEDERRAEQEDEDV